MVEPMQSGPQFTSIQTINDSVNEASFAKITRPTVDRSVLRHRLFTRLDESRGSPITWISGPGGCGKTTLVSSYVETRKYPTLWYQADSGDEDLATFFYHLGLAAKKASTSLSQPLPLFTAEYLLGIAEFSRNFFTLLFEQLEEQTVLVVDNLQEIQHDAPVYGAILEGISRIRAGIRLVLISRSDPPPAYVSLRANRSIDLLGWHDLRLTFEEFEQIVNQRGFAHLSLEKLKGLYNLLDGWAAGLHLILEDARVHNFEAKGTSWNREEIFEYFGSQILDRLDPATQTFLLQTSIFPNMTVSMAKKLNGHPSAAKLLENLHRNNQFTEKRVLENEVFQYHPIFREFLKRHARERFSRKDLISIQLRAAMLLLENGQPEHAVSLLAEAGAWDDLERQIIQHAPAMMAQGRYRALEGWLRLLPEEKLIDSPWLLYWRGACLIPFNLVESREYLTRAYGRFKAQHDRVGLILSWSDIITTFIAEFASFPPLDDWIEEIDSLLSGSPISSSPEIEAKFTISVFSALMFRQPYHPDMASWTERMERLTYEDVDLNLRFTAGSRLLLHYSYKGDLSRATRIFNSLRHFARSDTTPTFLVLYWLANEAAYLRLISSYDRSITMVLEGLELAKKSGIGVFDTTFCALGTWISLGKGDQKTAAQFLSKMAPAIPSHRTNDTARHLYLQALSSALSGDFATGEETARVALELTRKTGFSFSEGLCSIAVGHLCTELGKYKEAAVHLSRAGEIARRNKNLQLEYKSLLFSSYLALSKEDEEAALDLLQKAMTLGREQGYFEHCWWQPAVMTVLCVKALETGIEIPYVQELIRKRRLVPDTPPFAIESWPWPIRVFTLGRFELVVKDRVMRASDKARNRPLALLKALIALGGRKVRESEITDALWPDSDGDLAHRSFATTLHRLRKLLDLPEAIRLRGGRLTLDDRYCWIDVWAMERMLSQAEMTREVEKDQAASPSVHLAEKAIGLYKGSFLPNDVDEPWAIHRRERLRSVFLRAVEDLGQNFERVGKWADTINYYREALEVDPVAELFYRRLMICYHHLGRKAEALAVYDRCRNMLATVLCVEPSIETQALRKKLSAN